MISIVGRGIAIQGEGHWLNIYGLYLGCNWKLEDKVGHFDIPMG